MSRLSVDNQFAINQTGNYFYSNPPPYAASSLYKEKTHIIFVIHLLLNNSCSTIHLTNLAAMNSSLLPQSYAQLLTYSHQVFQLMLNLFLQLQVRITIRLPGLAHTAVMADRQ